ncbi:MAG: site-specific integrase [Candidatus Kaistia colombiensis]|nr:MAG: site-specific integrase [Kaistia sp.]
MRDAVRWGKPRPKSLVLPRAEASRDLELLGPLYDFVCKTEWDAMRAATDLKRNGLHVVEYFGRKKDVREIQIPDIADLKAHLAKRGNSTATINRKCAALSKMLHVAVDADVLVKVPKIKRNVEVKTRFRYIDEQEERAIMAYWKARGWTDYADLTTLLVDTGARCFSEMIAAHWDAFGHHNGSVTFWTTKTNQPRTVPVTKRCREILARRRGLHGHNAGPFTMMRKGTMAVRWDAMQETLGLHDVTPHTLRHTCCTRLILGGVDVKRVMEWMGHSTITTTMRYMQIRPGALHEALQVLERGLE